MGSYTFAETARILRVSPERLRYWRRTDLLRRGPGEPVDAAGGRSGRSDDDLRLGFDFRDLVDLRGVVGLLADGVPLRRIRRSVDRLRSEVPDLDDPLRGLHVHGSSGRVVVRVGDVLVEPGGQLVLDFAGEADGAVAPLHAVAEAEGVDGALAWFERGSAFDGDPATYEAAAAAYRRAIELEPDFADAHCNLGTLHYNRGDREAARARYEEALRIDPGHLEASFNLGNLFEEEGRRETALHYYKAAVRADPFFPEAHLNLALLYEKLGLTRAAREHWRRYLQIVPEGSWADLARQRIGEGPEGEAR